MKADCDAKLIDPRFAFKPGSLVTKRIDESWYIDTLHAEMSLTEPTVS